jgi:hypothetical protein
MHPWIVGQIVRLHQADLDREADRARLAETARSAASTARRPGAGPSGLRPRDPWADRAMAGLAEMLFGRHTPHLKGH